MTGGKERRGEDTRRDNETGGDAKDDSTWDDSRSPGTEQEFQKRRGHWTT
jgi:hypothetical protein